MPQFFELTAPQTEDKVITRQDRIFDDKMIIGNGASVHTLTTTSYAPKQKIKFFLDAIEVRVFGPEYDEDENPDDYEDKVFKIGKWYELEDQESGMIFNSAGFFYFKFVCGTGPGTYSFMFQIEQNNMPLKLVLSLYISAISFADSYVKPNSGWYDPANPDNLIDRSEPEFQPGLPDGAELHDFLVEGENGPEWQNGKEVMPYLPYPVIADPDAPEPIEAAAGVVKIDGITMIVDVDGFIKPNIDNDTLYVDDDPDSDYFEKIRARKANYSLSEQDTGLKWLDGRTIYTKLLSLGPLPNSTTKSVPHGISNLDFMISMYGAAKDSTAGFTYPLPYVTINALANCIQLYVQGANIVINVGSNRTTATVAYILLTYVKTT